MHLPRCDGRRWARCLPPPERRGLVLVDPPYEAADEFSHLVAGSAARPRTLSGRGVVAAWYPIKDIARRSGIFMICYAIQDSGIRDVVAAEFCGCARHVDPGATERQRPADDQPALPIRGSHARPILDCIAGPAGRSRSRAKAFPSCYGWSMSKTIAVLGAGAWGTALAVQAAMRRHGW